MTSETAGKLIHHYLSSDVYEAPLWTDEHADTLVQYHILAQRILRRIESMYHLKALSCINVVRERS